MPMVLEHIDAIARKKGRGVLFLDFRTLPEDKASNHFMDFDSWRRLPIRKTIIDWITANNIGWKSCAEYADTSDMGIYRGQIYIDVPYDTSLPEYNALAAFLEHPDGTCRFPEVFFFFLPLDIAMRNAEHDEPGFWDRWGADF